MHASQRFKRGCLSCGLVGWVRMYMHAPMHGRTQYSSTPSYQQTPTNPTSSSNARLRRWDA